MLTGENSVQTEPSIGQYVSKDFCKYNLWTKPLFHIKSVDFPLLIYFPVWNDLWEIALTKPNGTNAGILLGSINLEKTDSYIMITGFMEAQYSNNSNHLTFLKRSWSFMEQTAASQNNFKKCVGSFHLHDGQGAGLTRQDLSIYKHLAAGEGQIAVTLDPYKGEYCFYYQQDEKILSTFNVYVFCNSKDHMNESIDQFLNQHKTFKSMSDKKDILTFFEKTEGLLFVDSVINEIKKGKHPQIETKQTQEATQKEDSHSHQEHKLRSQELSSGCEIASLKIELQNLPEQTHDSLTGIESNDFTVLSIPPINQKADDININASARNTPVHTLDIRIADDLHFEQAYEQVRGAINSKLSELMLRMKKYDKKQILFSGSS